MRRFGIIATTALLAGVGALGLTGCAATDDPAQDAVAVASSVGVEAEALAALGFDPVDLQPTGGPSAGPERDRKGDGPRNRHRARLLGKHTLHGEVVVQTKEGTKTIVVQRGTVTAIDGHSMTVKSTDGFTMTWTFGERLRVVERRTSVQPDEVKVGDTVGVAGAKDGDNGVARLIVIPTGK